MNLDIDIKNVSVTIEDRVITSMSGLPGNVSDWYTRSGSFQVVLLNNNYDTCIKIPNVNHFDSFRLMVADRKYNEPNGKYLPIKKYTAEEMRRLYSLLMFQFENGIGNEVGRLFDITINGDTYFAFEVERLPERAWHQEVCETHNISDEDEINTWFYNELRKPGGIIELYRSNNALRNYDSNHILALKHPDSGGKQYTVGAKSDVSIFFVDDNGIPKMFDIDINTINAYFQDDFMNKIVKEYSSVIDERNYSDYL